MEIYIPELLKGQYGSICGLSWSELALCAFIDQCFLNGSYRSNHIVCDSNFLKFFETEKKYEPLMKTS